MLRIGQQRAGRTHVRLVQLWAVCGRGLHTQRVLHHVHRAVQHVLLHPYTPRGLLPEPPPLCKGGHRRAYRAPARTRRATAVALAAATAAAAAAAVAVAAATTAQPLAAAARPTAAL